MGGERIRVVTIQTPNNIIRFECVFLSRHLKLFMVHFLRLEKDPIQLGVGSSQ